MSSEQQKEWVFDLEDQLPLKEFRKRLNNHSWTYIFGALWSLFMVVGALWTALIYTDIALIPLSFMALGMFFFVETMSKLLSSQHAIFVINDGEVKLRFSKKFDHDSVSYYSKVDWILVINLFKPEDFAVYHKNDKIFYMWKVKIELYHGRVLFILSEGFFAIPHDLDELVLFLENTLGVPGSPSLRHCYRALHDNTTKEREARKKLDKYDTFLASVIDFVKGSSRFGKSVEGRKVRLLCSQFLVEHAPFKNPIRDLLFQGLETEREKFKKEGKEFPELEEFLASCEAPQEAERLAS